MKLMNVKKIIIFVFFLFSISYTLFADAGQQNKSNDTARNSIYNIFLYEKTVCRKFVRTIAEDKDFIENVENKLLDYRERKSGQRIFEMLATSKSKKIEVVQYVLKNSNYFLIDLDFHEKPGMTYVKDSCIYCMQTEKRLKEIEDLGPSEQSWKVREYYLDLELDGLLEFGMPWSEGPVRYDFEYLKAKVDSTKKLYSQQYKNYLKNWVQKASVRLKGETNNSRINEKQISKVESWIAELNKGLD